VLFLFRSSRWIVALIVGGLGMPAMISAFRILPAYANSDYNNDGRDDLAIGEENQGAVNVLFGSLSGLSASRDEFWNQDLS
jgi:hypothetical protein